MASNEPIGKVDKLIIIGNDGIEETETALSNKFKFNENSTYGEIDTVSRSINSLSNNTYIDTTLVTNISVNEKIAE